MRWKGSIIRKLRWGAAGGRGQENAKGCLQMLGAKSDVYSVVEKKGSNRAAARRLTQHSSARKLEVLAAPPSYPANVIKNRRGKQRPRAM